MKWLLWFDLPLILAFAVAVVKYAWAWDVHHVVGMALTAIGTALWFTARLQLGTSFAVLPKAKALVTSGIYSKFRNPVYLFGGVAYGGLFIAWGQPAPLVVFLVMYPIYQYFRARKEAQVLEQAFGDEYRRYKANTWL
ncbi:MAG TPA: isoprenylcysteine carboxylmethyltransferase family protein [Terriglobia bacterium]|nr:isoprenylcysteine carboxylmethyltransferase family protein [Terriglobia bacterium]